MNKGRILRMGIALVVAIVMQLIVNAFSTVDVALKENVYFEDMHSAIVEELNGKIAKTKRVQSENIEIVKSNLENARYIITSDSSKIDSDNVIAWSPIIAVFPNRISKNGEKNFSVTNISKAGTTENKIMYSVDMQGIINAFIESKGEPIDLETFGITGAKDKVPLAIPDTTYQYRKDVVNQLIWFITNGEPVTEENKVEVKAKLNMLLEKAVQIKNIDKESVNNDSYIMLIPEYTVINNDGSYRTIPVYWNDCKTVSFGIIRNYKQDDKNFSAYEDIYAELMYYFRNKYDSFWSTLKLRNNLEFSNGYSKYNYIARTVPFNSFQTDFREILGDNYWN